jgi:rhodanese-related sulfurtransferase
MKHIKYILFVVTFIIIGCESKPKYENIIMVDSEEMKALLNEEEVQLVDVRTVEEFSEHYIPGAENIVFDDNFDLKLDNLNKEKPVVVYCRKGRRSKKCAEILSEKGFVKIYDLKGGITQWMKEGHAVK